MGALGTTPSHPPPLWPLQSRPRPAFSCESRPSLPLGLDSPHVCQGQLPLIFSFPAGGLADSPLHDLGASPQPAQNRGLNAQRASSHCILGKTGRAWLLGATRRERWVESLAGFYSLLIPGDKNKFQCILNSQYLRCVPWGFCCVLFFYFLC